MAVSASLLRYATPCRYSVVGRAAVWPQENDDVALRPALRVLRSLLSISDDLAEWRLNAALDVACMCIAANQEVCVALLPWLLHRLLLPLILRSHSISSTRAPGIPKYKIGLGRGKDGRVGEGLIGRGRGLAWQLCWPLVSLSRLKWRGPVLVGAMHCGCRTGSRCRGERGR